MALLLSRNTLIGAVSSPVPWLNCIPPICVVVCPATSVRYMRAVSTVLQHLAPFVLRKMDSAAFFFPAPLPTIPLACARSNRSPIFRLLFFCCCQLFFVSAVAAPPCVSRLPEQGLASALRLLSSSSEYPIQLSPSSVLGDVFLFAPICICSSPEARVPTSAGILSSNSTLFTSLSPRFISKFRFPLFLALCSSRYKLLHFAYRPSWRHLVKKLPQPFPRDPVRVVEETSYLSHRKLSAPPNFSHIGKRDLPYQIPGFAEKRFWIRARAAPA